MKRMFKNKFILCLCLGMLAGKAFGIHSVDFKNNEMKIIVSVKGEEQERRQKINSIKSGDHTTWSELLLSGGFKNLFQTFNPYTIWCDRTKLVEDLEKIKPQHTLSWRTKLKIDSTRCLNGDFKNINKKLTNCNLLKVVEDTITIECKLPEDDLLQHICLEPININSTDKLEYAVKKVSVLDRR